MGIFACDVLIFGVLFLTVSLCVFYVRMKYVYSSYWQKRGVYSPQACFPIGHLGKVGIKFSLGERLMHLYQQTKQYPYVGLVLALKKTLLVNDTEVVKMILSKHFEYFQGHGTTVDEKSDPLSGHLFNLEGEEWKNMRVKLTPTFTSSKMKYMFDTMLSCSKEMLSYIEEKVESGQFVDLKEVLAKFGTDVIGSCAFGIQTNSFKYPDAEFRKMGKKIFTSSVTKILINIWRLLSPNTVPKQILKWRAQKISHFFKNIIRDTIEQRESSNITRNDFLQLLINMKNSDVNSGNHLTYEEIVPQVFIFFIAGFETSSTVATYAFLELARNPHLQEELHKQIDNVMEETGGELTYDALNKMTYLSQIVQESMRMYPPLPMIFRICNKDFNIPGTETVIEKGTLVFIPALGIHRDPDIYPDPLKFDPDRFNPDKTSIMNPYANIPFGEGPRICIGSRFGLMQVKLGLFMVLSRFKVEICEKTALPIVFDPAAFLLHTKGDMMLKLSPRKSLQKSTN